MATINATSAIDNVDNGTYFVRVELLTASGQVVAQANSNAITVSSNPEPTVGAPVVTVS